MATSPDLDRLDDAAMARDAMALLSRYVQFDTTNPPGDELAAAQWLRDQIIARGITTDITVFEPAAGRGLVVAHHSSVSPKFLTRNPDRYRSREPSVLDCPGAAFVLHY